MNHGLSPEEVSEQAGHLRARITLLNRSADAHLLAQHSLQVQVEETRAEALALRWLYPDNPGLDWLENYGPE